MMRLRRIEPRDHDALLALNAANWPAVTRLTHSDLKTLFSYAGTHWVIELADSGRIIGYLLSFPSDSGYDDEEIRAFRARVPQPFFYVCQVALASEYRGRGLGRALYAAVYREARRSGCSLICAEVNCDPPNEPSLRFHLAQGFRPLAELAVSFGIRVLMLTRPMPADTDDENGSPLTSGSGRLG